MLIWRRGKNHKNSHRKHCSSTQIRPFFLGRRFSQFSSFERGSYPSAPLRQLPSSLVTGPGQSDFKVVHMSHIQLTDTPSLLRPTRQQQTTTNKPQRTTTTTTTTNHNNKPQRTNHNGRRQRRQRRRRRRRRRQRQHTRPATRPRGHRPQATDRGRTLWAAAVTGPTATD